MAPFNLTPFFGHLPPLVFFGSLSFPLAFLFSFHSTSLILSLLSLFFIPSFPFILLSINTFFNASLLPSYLLNHLNRLLSSLHNRFLYLLSLPNSENPSLPSNLPLSSLSICPSLYPLQAQSLPDSILSPSHSIAHSIIPTIPLLSHSPSC